MSDMVANGEFDSLVAERVWAELEKGLMEKHYWRLFCVLHDCGALDKLAAYKLDEHYTAFQCAADANTTLQVRCAAMFKSMSPNTFALLRIPSAISELAQTADAIELFKTCKAPQDMLCVFNRADVFRRYDRFIEALNVVKYRDSLSRHQVQKLNELAILLDMLDTSKIVQDCANSAQIKDAIFNARVAIIARNM